MLTSFSEKNAHMQAKYDRMQAACSLHTIVFRGRRRELQRVILLYVAHQGLMQATYDRELRSYAGCITK